MRKKVILAVALFSFAAIGAANNPYSSVTPDQAALFKPVIDRYVRDQIKHDWADLWDIQDQTSDLKGELLLGHDAPDLNKQQFVAAMRQTIGVGYPQLRSFELREVRPDKDHFIMIGCGTATRESWKQKGFIVAGIRIIDGKAKVDLWSMTSNSC